MRKDHTTSACKHPAFYDFEDEASVEGWCDLCREANPQPVSLCDRCGNPHEWYMLHNSMWNAVTDNTKENNLCLSCVQIRLGNTLAPKHFTDAPINYGYLGFDVRKYFVEK